jgi:hypothetical protein
MKPICIPCQRFYKPLRTGFAFVEGMPLENGAPPGTEAPEKWGPYKLWIGDSWLCDGCGNAIIVGVGSSRVAEHYEPDFKDLVERYDAHLQVNDC